MTLNNRTGIPEQTVQTQIRLLLSGAVWSESALFAIPAAILKTSQGRKANFFGRITILVKKS